ncbi:hypothetical protein P0D87_12910 [Paraburkholderia sp. RL17-368-BIF-A]|jgi:hypothetical protein|uniref:hypothetical protein n=1 Tax=Paraburkholderia sp. RL17-368-BIF-A TaxID=3031628 RepID=UPI0006B3EDE6|nr:hypothetical protein AC233_32130 [Burkholderia sp. HB1]
MPGWLQALFGIVTPIIVAAGVAVAFQQRQLAHRNLKHALFDRRWAVYAATNDVLVSHMNWSDDEQEVRLAEFLRRKMDAQFLFGIALRQYLDSVQTAVNQYCAAVRIHKRIGPSPDNERPAAEAAVLSASDALRILHHRLVEQFRPSLALDKT